MRFKKIKDLRKRIEKITDDMAKFPKTYLPDSEFWINSRRVSKWLDDGPAIFEHHVHIVYRYKVEHNESSDD